MHDLSIKQRCIHTQQSSSFDHDLINLHSSSRVLPGVYSRSLSVSLSLFLPTPFLLTCSKTTYFMRRSKQEMADIIAFFGVHNRYISTKPSLLTSPLASQLAFFRSQTSLRAFGAAPAGFCNKFLCIRRSWHLHPIYLDLNFSLQCPRIRKENTVHAGYLNPHLGCGCVGDGCV